MRRLGLGRLRVNVAGRGVSFPLMGWEQSIESVMTLGFRDETDASDAETDEVLNY